MHHPRQTIRPRQGELAVFVKNHIWLIYNEIKNIISPVGTCRNYHETINVLY